MKLARGGYAAQPEFSNDAYPAGGFTRLKIRSP
jgi:hypothetical protein